MTAVTTEPLIGVINAGSSSLKFSFYEGERRILAGQVDGLGARPSASATGPAGEAIVPPDLGAAPPATPSEVLPAVLPWARERLGARRLAALGHRVVHGGMHHSRPARVTPELLGELEALVPLAPLHEPHNLAPIRTALALDPELPQVACFDTAFHRTAPEVEQAFALPYALGSRSRQQWASRPSMACLWAPVVASLIRAWCCISFSRGECRRKR